MNSTTYTVNGITHGSLYQAVRDYVQGKGPRSIVSSDGRTIMSSDPRQTLSRSEGERDITIEARWDWAEERRGKS